jgi:hypothetical protein
MVYHSNGSAASIQTLHNTALTGENLHNRKGVGNELEEIADDIYRKMKSELIAITILYLNSNQ